MSAIIKATDLTKYFGGEIKAVDQLSFSVYPGQVYGFLGQNGAGKSTTIRMLLTLINPDSGEIEIFGKNLRLHRKEILRKVGALVERPDLYKYLTALDNLKIFAALSGIKLTESQLMDQLDKVGLAERANSKVKTYSQGMKQRLGIAVALVHDPELVILDEPMNGLDPQGIADVRSLILHLGRDLKKTVFISSHLLSEMEQVADSLLIIHRGKKVADGKMEEMLNPGSSIVEIETSSVEELIGQLKNTKWANGITPVNGSKILVHMRREDIPMLIRAIGSMNTPVYSIRNKQSLEDYFLSVTAQ
jgi:ABC-type multidrug transport system ATPase subunit